MAYKENKEERWTTSKAIEKAAEIGVSLTAPTVIKLCQEHGIGYQMTGPHGTWQIRPEQFMKLIRGDWDK